MSFQRYETEDRRLQTLRLLEQSTGYAASAFLLGTALQGMGHHVSHDRVLADIDWLTEQDLVISDSVGGVTVATLTGRGADTAAGRTRVSGVKRPLPGE